MQAQDPDTPQPDPERTTSIEDDPTPHPTGAVPPHGSHRRGNR